MSSAYVIADYFETVLSIFLIDTNQALAAPRFFLLDFDVDVSPSTHYWTSNTGRMII